MHAVRFMALGVEFGLQSLAGLADKKAAMLAASML